MKSWSRFFLPSSFSTFHSLSRSLCVSLSLYISLLCMMLTFVAILIFSCFSFFSSLFLSLPHSLSVCSPCFFDDICSYVTLLLILSLILSCLSLLFYSLALFFIYLAPCLCIHVVISVSVLCCDVSVCYYPSFVFFPFFLVSLSFAVFLCTSRCLSLRLCAMPCDVLLSVTVTYLTFLFCLFLSLSLLFLCYVTVFVC